MNFSCFFLFLFYCVGQKSSTCSYSYLFLLWDMNIETPTDHVKWKMKFPWEPEQVNGHTDVNFLILISIEHLLYPFEKKIMSINKSIRIISIHIPGPSFESTKSCVILFAYRNCAQSYIQFCTQLFLFRLSWNIIKIFYAIDIVIRNIVDGIDSHCITCIQGSMVGNNVFYFINYFYALFAHCSIHRSPRFIYYYYYYYFSFNIIYVWIDSHGKRR